MIFVERLHYLRKHDHFYEKQSTERKFLMLKIVAKQQQLCTNPMQNYFPDCTRRGLTATADGFL